MGVTANWFCRYNIHKSESEGGSRGTGPLENGFRSDAVRPHSDGMGSTRPQHVVGVIVIVIGVVIVDQHDVWTTVVGYDLGTDLVHMGYVLRRDDVLRTTMESRTAP